MTITHITERELTLQRENERLLNTIRVQAAAIEAMKADAARYRWLRNVDTEHAPLVSTFRKERTALDAVIDAVIDAAMKESK